MKPTHWRVGPVFAGYVLSAFIFTCLMYALLFHVRADAIQGCERGNMRAREINERAPVINTLVKIERGEREAGEAVHRLGNDGFPIDLHVVRPVSLADCDAAYDKPWPFG